MKIAKLLVLVALSLLGNNVARAVDGNVWTKPAPEFASLVDGEVYYFYNTGSDLFFTQGNAWGTQASVGRYGLKVRVEQQSEGVYVLTDSVATQGAWKMWWFVDDGVGMYVDYNNQPDFLWEITSMGDNVYRLSPSAQNPNVNDNTLFVGLDRTTSATNTALAANLTADGGYFIDWKLMPEAVGRTYFPALEKYDAAMELKDLLNEAEANGLNVAAQVAVYNNTGSTLDELKKAVEEVKVIIANMQEEKATVENPADVTSKYITNPTFAGDNLSGWSGTAFGSYGPKENAEHYNKTYDTYQNLTDLREGIYRFNVHAFYRAGNAQPAYDNFKAQNEASRRAKVYAANGTDSLTNSIASPYTARLTEQMTSGTWSEGVDSETGESFWIPNNMEAANEFFNAGYCNDNAVIVAVKEGKLRVGVRKDASEPGDWSIFDDFSLTYYGNGDDAWRLYLQTALANINDVDVEGKVVTQSYVDAYNAAREAAASASTKDEIEAAIRAIQTASADLEKNIKLWQDIEALREEARTMGADEHFEEEYTEPCSDWAEFESEDLIASHELTNEEIEAEIVRVKEMIDEARRHPRNGADMTGLMVNADFEQGATGWTKVAASGGNVGPGGTSTNTCYEAWNNANFDIYQVVDNAPMGVYEISVKGFYRYGRTAYQSYLDGEYYTTKESCPVFIYMNANTTPFTNVYGDPVQITDKTFYSENSNDYTSEKLADGTELYFPNGMASAAIAFSNDMYKQSAYGLVAHQGDEIRIGVKGSSNQLGDSWSIWDDFKLTFRGFQADVVKPVLEQAIIDGENSLNAGIGKDVAADLQSAIDAAKAVVNGEDGKAMFEALTQLFEMQERVNASRELFAKLQAANERLAVAIGNAVASKAIQDEANALNQSITAGIENRTFADSDVEGLINDINKMINRLGIPQTMDQASDANPVECTTIIVNPAYVDGTDEGWTGGASVNATANDAEKFNTNFDYFQLLQGLPAGTYKVSVQGFYRAGGYANDYETFNADATANNNAFLYAAVGEDTVSVAMHRLASQPIVMEGLSDGWVYVDETNMLAVPNSMATAGDAFQTPGNDDTNLYSNNNVIVKVGEDGILTIGLKKNVTLTDDWTIWTQWQLFYYGKNSTLTPSDNPLSIDNMDANMVVSSEVFTVNGVRANGLQKGVNIVRQTLSDGTVVVKKVTVK
jgi:hypothetical protein